MFFSFSQALTAFFSACQTFFDQTFALCQHGEHWPIGKTPQDRENDEKVDRLGSKFCPIDPQLLSELVTRFNKGTSQHGGSPGTGLFVDDEIDENRETLGKRHP